MSTLPRPSECLSDDDLWQLLEGGQNADDAARCEQHLETCGSCQQRLEDLAGQLPNCLREPTTRESDSAALSSAISDLCELRPAGSGKTKYSFLGPPNRTDQLGLLGKYEIQGIIGQGGMGVVFTAVDPTLRRQVAIKVPLPSLVASRPECARFLREARAIASVRHDNIVTVYAAEESANTPFMVMERIDGKSLERELTDRHKLPFDEVLLIATQACAALEAAHAEGLVHRDIKPGNILLEAKTGRVQVTDFGLAKSLTENSLTMPGTLAGTPEYMAPEQATGETVTAQSDLFSLGVVLYRALTGSSPFRGKNILSTLQLLCTKTPPAVSALEPTVPEWFDDLLQRMLAKDPSERPESAKEVLELLQGKLSKTDRIGATSDKKDPLVSWRSRIGLAMTGIGAVAIAVVIWLQTGDVAKVISDDEAGFVVSGQHFSDLGTAIIASRDGEVIEIFGDGPFAARGFDVGRKRLEIRAAGGSHPVFRNAANGESSELPFLKSKADLTLDGLEVHWQMNRPEGTFIGGAAGFCLVVVEDGDLRLAGCRLQGVSMTGCAGVSGGSANISGSELIAERGSCLVWSVTTTDGRAILRNSRFDGHAALLCSPEPENNQRQNIQIELTNNMLLTSRGVQLARPKTRVMITATRNTFDVSDVLVLTGARQSMLRIIDHADVIRLLETCVDWTGEQNAFRSGVNFFSRSINRMNQPTRPELDSLAAWQDVWDSDLDSTESDLESLKAAAGTGVGSMGIGANLNDVGPFRQ